MSGSVNKVILIGNLGADPDIKRTQDGRPIANLSIATSESYKDKNGEKVEKTEWHNIVLWRGLAEIAERYLKKGNSIYLEGKLQTRSWEDKEGNTRYTTEIVGDNMTMLGRRDDQDNSARQEEKPSQNQKVSQPQTSNQKEEEDDDDLPF